MFYGDRNGRRNVRRGTCPGGIVRGKMSSGDVGGGHLGRAVTSSGGHSSVVDVAGSTLGVYQISPGGGAAAASPLSPTLDDVIV